MKIKILLLIFSIFFITGCSRTTDKLFIYKDYPCENNIFKTVNKMALVVHGKSAMKESLYHITRNGLEEYHDYIENRNWTPYIEKKIYPIGSEFQVIGYYWPIVIGGYFPTPSNVQYYLVKSIEDNNIAWIASFVFNSKECHPHFYSYETRFSDRNSFKLERHSHKEEEIDLSKLTKKPFE